ncbi:transposase [Clostridium collagenovorans]|uniref:transposase n=1 Tax=Clostridium collagenovorans TaxID=29357 RepID=UPI001FA8E16B
MKSATDQGKKVTHVAKDIGDSEATVRGWIRRYKEHGKNAFPGSRNLGPDDEEIRRLKKRSADIEEENAILYPIGHAKKAILIFTKP